ncbi:rCG22954, partial [Rattus norvegicus]
MKARSYTISVLWEPKIRILRMSLQTRVGCKLLKSFF